MRHLKYFYLQLKRFAHALPSVIFLSLALFVCLFIAISAVMQNEKQEEQKYEIGIVGDASDTYLKLGIAALQNFDNTRFAMNVSFLSEDEAKRMLESGELSAYILIPEGFIMDAYRGDVGKLTYVTDTKAIGAADYIKDELLDMISVLLVESQKGVYAAGNIAYDLAGMKYGKVTNDAALEYVDLILARSKAYKLDILGVSEGLGFGASVLCGVMLLFLMLICIGFAPVFARGSIAFGTILSSRRFGVTWQIICEYFAFMLCGAFSAAIFFFGLFGFMGEEISALAQVEIGAEFFLSLFLSFLMISAMQILIFEATEGIWAGVLSQFLAAIGLSYFSGCLYPIYFFPEIIQKISVFLPTGAARSLLARTLADKDILQPLAVIITYLLVFMIGAILIRYRKITKASGDAI